MQVVTIYKKEDVKHGSKVQQTGYDTLRQLSSKQRKKEAHTKGISMAGKWKRDSGIYKTVSWLWRNKHNNKINWKLI